MHADAMISLINLPQPMLQGYVVAYIAQPQRATVKHSDAQLSFDKRLALTAADAGTPASRLITQL